jgi:hypothetical protein
VVAQCFAPGIDLQLQQIRERGQFIIRGDDAEPGRSTRSRVVTVAEGAIGLEFTVEVS